MARRIKKIKSPHQKFHDSIEKLMKDAGFEIEKVVTLHRAQILSPVQKEIAFLYNANLQKKKTKYFLD